jgi:hypothetical protein
MPKDIPRSIRFEFNIDGLDDRRLGWWCDGKIGHGFGERILSIQSAKPVSRIQGELTLAQVASLYAVAVELGFMLVSAF